MLCRGNGSTMSQDRLSISSNRLNILFPWHVMSFLWLNDLVRTTIITSRYHDLLYRSYDILSRTVDILSHIQNIWSRNKHMLSRNHSILPCNFNILHRNYDILSLDHDTTIYYLVNHRILSRFHEILSRYHDINEWFNI